MNQIIDFYEETGPDGSGRMIDEVLSKSHLWLERSHDVIQWLFPLREPSNFNPEAPLLDDDTVAYFKNALEKKQGSLYRNFTQAISYFLDFLGIRQTETGFDISESFQAQHYTWMEFNHNSLRITRFLACLSIFGMNEFASNLLEFMKKIAGGNVSANTMSYWEGALEEK